MDGMEREDDRRLVAEVRARGQGHVFRFWDAISPEGRRRLLDQLASVDFDQIDSLVRNLVDEGPHRAILERDVRPPDVIPLPRSPVEREERARARREGEVLLAQGRVAVMTVAGGQGTRLGFDAPKGMFPIGPVTDRSLFRIHAEKILATGRRHGRPLLWLLLTSDATHAPTVEAFEQEGFFGLEREDVHFLPQRMMPSVDLEGALLLAEKDAISMSPNGHGGALLALRERGGLDRMRERGADLLFYHQVDNPTVPVPDPVMLGYHGHAGAEMSSKVVEKTDPNEKVGVLAQVAGRTRVIEYSDLPQAMAEARDTDGRLLFRAGSIAVHVFGRSFVERLTEGGLSLPFHVARKAIPHVDADGRKIEPERKNGIKFETFVFDALPEARVTVSQEVDRREEFAPVKNAEGEDSPATARRLLADLYGRWLRAAGVEVPFDAEGHVVGSAEISPLFALDQEECVAKLRGRGIRFHDTIVLAAPDA